MRKSKFTEKQIVEILREREDLKKFLGTCDICNNAKSDFISAKNFKVINGFWKQVLQKEVLFDDNAKIWNKE
ncbi:hypothetical protein Q6A75_00335 [Aliarcobacter skirrowii]|uniref:hypothetical protein n=1 Tax=Aliarcobacter skirrowii TaxID=28200 RepID=UPI0029B295EF|nr:hypothetical protein [Aliarcobacter skirrowii]MDX4047368.1 hypothetical protein [Aliarcobacter skirrowii]